MSGKKPRISAWGVNNPIARKWSIAEIVREFEDTIKALWGMGPAVSIFGSARLAPDSPYYEMTVKIAKHLSEAGYMIISGGGPGIMEAANKGGQEGGTPTIGLNIKLPHEQVPNPYQDIEIHYNHFFSRKSTFIECSEAFICMPGGFGTLDELTEVLTLIQTQKKPAMPIILVDRKFWAPMVEWFKSSLLREGTIAEEDLSLFHIVDTYDEVIECFFKLCGEKIGCTPGQDPA